MDLDRLDQVLAAQGEPAFRARQVWAWMARGVSSYEAMTDLPGPLRETLARELPFSSLDLREQATALDGTVKALFATADDRPLEAVLMRFRDGRRSICVSSQSGCPLTCAFCATGTMRFGRNLTASEILDQALEFRRLEALDHCVFMGMGEPMMNLDAVLGACERLPDLGITHRRTTISTVGWIPGIEQLAEQPMPVRLALSLHAADDPLRSELMPVNKRYPLADVIAACKRFYERKRRRIFIEYVMLAGVNDRYEQAVSLARLLDVGAGRSRTSARGAGPTAAETSIFKVNLIPFNPTGTSGRDGVPFQGSSRDSIAAFKGALESRGISATVRLTRGRDIAAACGQLAATAATTA
jgi:23S rRNA (adenine2503-C2)-methyltransferase